MVNKMFLADELVYSADETQIKYVPCDWIASANGSYIDTGVYVNPNYSVEVVAKIYKYADKGWDTLFGTRNGSNARFTMRDNDNSTSFAVHWSASAESSYSGYSHNMSRVERVTNWHKYGLYGNTIKIDDTTIYSFEESADTTSFPYPLYLCAVNNAGTAADFGYYYIKSCKVWDDSGALVRNFVPVFEEASRRYGLYDNVNKVFYPSSNTTALVGNVREAELPSGYTEVDFIRFTASQYILLEESVSPTDCFKAEWKWNDATTAQQRLFSTGRNDYLFHLYINGSKLNAFNYGSAAKWVSTTTAADLGRNYLLFDGNAKSLFIDAHNTKKTFSLSSYSVGDAATNLYIGQDYRAMTSMDLYYLRKYEMGVLVRDLVPCHDGNGVYGLYDILKGEFLTSSSETAFLGGYIKD